MIGVASKPAVVKTVSAVPERSSQPLIHTAAIETKKEPQTTLSQVRVTSRFLKLHPQNSSRQHGGDWAAKLSPQYASLLLLFHG